MKIITTFFAATCFSIFSLQAQTDNGIVRFDEFRLPKKREIINIPKVNGLQVLKADFHMHTVFSDGHVWPNVRIQEAWKEGLDAMAFTEHMEYQKYKEYVKVDHIRSYELAKDLAKEHNITLIKGTEITRDTPPGHFNALFIKDQSNFVNTKDPKLDQLSIDKAAAQNAFIFWNHPGWKASQIKGSYEWTDFVDKQYKDKKLHGIEVVNGFGFHKKALDWALDRNLTVIGNTDIHNLIAHEYDIERKGVHRTMTLIFSKDRSEKSIREALDEGNTVAWSSKYLIGKENNVRNLFNACVSVAPSHHQIINKKKVKTKYYEIQNNSDLYFELELISGKGTKKIILYPSSSQIITAIEGDSNLKYKVVSTFIRSDKHLEVEFKLP